MEGGGACQREERVEEEGIKREGDCCRRNRDGGEEERKEGM